MTEIISALRDLDGALIRRRHRPGAAYTPCCHRRINCRPGAGRRARACPACGAEFVLVFAGESLPDYPRDRPVIDTGPVSWVPLGEPDGPLDQQLVMRYGAFRRTRSP